MGYRVALVDIASGQVMGQTSAIASKLDAETSCKRNNAMLKNMSLEYRVIESTYGEGVSCGNGVHHYNRDSLCVKCGIHSSEESCIHQRGGAGVCVKCGDGG